jgi:hypothetical protein
MAFRQPTNCLCRGIKPTPNTSSTPQPRQSTHERDHTIFPPPYDYKLGSSKLVDAAWYRKGEGAWRTVFGRKTFYEAWPAGAPFLTWLFNSVLRARSSIIIVSHLQTGKRPSQLLLVRINCSPDLIVAKIYDPYFFDPGEAICWSIWIDVKMVYSIQQH